MFLDELLTFSVPRFPHLQSNIKSSSYLTGLPWRLNELRWKVWGYLSTWLIFSLPASLLFTHSLPLEVLAHAGPSNWNIFQISQKQHLDFPSLLLSVHGAQQSWFFLHLTLCQPNHSILRYLLSVISDWLRNGHMTLLEPMGLHSEMFCWQQWEEILFAL